MICVLCEQNRTSGSLEFCRECWNLYKTDINEKKEWVRAVKNASQKEKRRREKEYNIISLDALLDWSYAKDKRD